MTGEEIDHWTEKSDHLVIQRHAVPVMVFCNQHGDLVNAAGRMMVSTRVKTSSSSSPWATWPASSRR